MSLLPTNERQSKPLRKILLWVLLIALVAFIGLRIYQSLDRANKAKAPPATQVQLKSTEIYTVAPNNFEQTLPLSGALTPYTQAVISARASGEVAQVLLREGQVAKKGQVLARLVSTTYQAQYQQALSNVSSAQSSLTLAQKDYENNAQLVKEGFIAKMALQKLEVSLSAAKSQLRNAQEAQVIAQRALSETTITAPVSGVIAVSKINTGDTVAVGSPLFTIVNTDKFEMIAPISAEQIGALQIGQEVQLTSAGIAQPFIGRVDRINPAAQNGSRSYSVYIAVENVSGSLKSGMFAQGNIVLNSHANTITIPATAIHQVNDRHFVYLVKDGKLAEQDVTMGARANDAIDAPVEIKSGLSAGDNIVRMDMGVLKTGLEVKITDPKQANPADTEKMATKP